MTGPLRWGIAGPGRIAATMAAEFGHVPDAELVAVGSRSEERAREFAERFRIPHAYGSYAELLASDVDVIYLATTHAQHTGIALSAIEAGKALLVEKSFTTSVADTTAIIEAARARGVFVMEGMWTRFLPAVHRVRTWVREGTIGEVRAVQGDLFAFREYDPSDRLFDPAVGGGAVFDLGVYGISFVQHLLGDPTVVHAVGSTYPNGVEGEFGILLGWPDGRFALEAAGFTTPGPGRQVIAGTRGWIEVRPRFHRADTVALHLVGEEPVELYLPHRGAGYSYEVEHVGECLRAGRTESPVMPLDDTLAVQRVMAEVLHQLGR